MERSHKSGFGGAGPRKMHKAVCAECGQECEVPFKPTEGKPVYCRDCFRNKRKY
jgi:DNA-directed RNA polymerase